MRSRYFPPLLIAAALLFTVSCSKAKKRCDTPKELANAILDALKEEDVNKYLALYPTLSECKVVADDMREGDSDDSDSDDDDDDHHHHHDKGLSENQLKHYFEDDRNRARKDFKSLLSDAKDKDINWKKAKVTDVQLPSKKSMHNGEKPGWITISLKSGTKHFYVMLGNTFKTDDGWNMGLECKMMDYVYDDGGDDVTSSSSWLNNLVPGSNAARQQMLMDSIRMADSMMKMQMMMQYQRTVDSLRADSAARANRKKHGP